MGNHKEGRDGLSRIPTFNLKNRKTAYNELQKWLYRKRGEKNCGYHGRDLLCRSAVHVFLRNLQYLSSDE